MKTRRAEATTLYIDRIVVAVRDGPLPIRRSALWVAVEARGGPVYPFHPARMDDPVAFLRDAVAWYRERGVRITAVSLDHSAGSAGLEAAAGALHLAVTRPAPFRPSLPVAVERSLARLSHSFESPYLTHSPPTGGSATKEKP
jgi:hypothetical protein